MKFSGHAGTAVNKKVSALDKPDKSDNKKNKVQKQLQFYTLRSF